MVVVADTTPLNQLILIRQVSLLNLTVLYLGAGRRLIGDFPAALNQLLQTGFRASPDLIQFFLDRHAARKKSKPGD